jgi:hypothetical protein
MAIQEPSNCFNQTIACEREHCFEAQQFDSFKPADCKESQRHATQQVNTDNAPTPLGDSCSHSTSPKIGIYSSLGATVTLRGLI